MQAAFTASPNFERSREYLKERFRYWNAFVIYYAFLGVIESVTVRACVASDHNQKSDREWTMSNGPQTVFGPFECFERNSMSKYINVRP
jgi:hypothetical protein